MLQRLSAEAAIRDLTARYSDAVGHLDAERAASGYIEDGSACVAGNELAGRDAIEAGMRETFARFDLLQLIQHGGLIDLHGNRANARWSTIELAVRRGGKDVSLIFGRYEDDLVHRPEGWRFARRSFTMAGRMQIDTVKIQLNPQFLASLRSGLADIA